MRFEIFTDMSGKFRFRLLANNNQIICQSEAYTRKASAVKGIKAVKKCAKSKILDRTK